MSGPLSQGLHWALAGVSMLLWGSYNTSVNMVVARNIGHGSNELQSALKNASDMLRKDNRFYRGSFPGFYQSSIWDPCPLGVPETFTLGRAKASHFSKPGMNLQQGWQNVTAGFEEPRIRFHIPLGECRTPEACYLRPHKAKDGL